MKKISSAIAILAMLVLAACNNSGENKTASTSTDPNTVTTPTTPPPAEFKPFDVVEVGHTVKDFSKWKTAFDGDSAARKANGMELIVIGRNDSNPNNLMLVMQVSDVQKAKAFTADPKLKETMDKAGVVSKPDITFYHVIRYNADSKEKQWVLLSHKVKDFDAWLKVFDGEGTAKRATFGLIDVAVARGIDDPNLVHIVFDIKDMAKAKARMNDPELKKIMTDAGVEGAPKIEFYTTAE